ncbi:DUF1622 domain-containing protein [Haloferula sp.]|jgi:uncharacterized membrane protein|uniref:DUF1622 domain-containing protein n=1 Tax=Haloferula sp. TaxID=2497595 RepID=UPI003C73C7EC
MEHFRHIMDIIGTGVDAVGVLIIVIGAIVALVRLLLRRSGSGYKQFREDFGRAILLALEFLVAGDIIRTVVVAPTMENVAVLGLLVLIRTFLSFSMQLEIDGRWPWQKASVQRDPN